MPEFRDRNNESWPVRLAFGDLQRIKSGAGVNLLEAFHLDNLAKTAADIFLVAEIVWSAVEPEALKRSIDKAKFFDRIGEDTLMEGFRAVAEALADFFRDARGDLLRMALKRATEAAAAIETQRRTLTTTLEEMPLDQLLRIPGVSPDASTTSSGSSPASPESNLGD